MKRSWKRQCRRVGRKASSQGSEGKVEVLLFDPRQPGEFISDLFATVQMEHGHSGDGCGQYEVGEAARPVG